MHSDDPQRLFIDQQLGDHGAARFERRKFQRRAVEHADMALHQDGIAVPADVARIDLEQLVRMPARLVEDSLVLHAEVDRLVDSMPVDELVRDGRPPAAEALVRLLQRDDVSVDLMKDVEHALGVALAVKADRLAHVVACNGDALRPAHATAQSPGGTMVPRRRGSRRSAHCPE